MALVLSPIQSRHSKKRNKPRQILIHGILNSNPGLVQRFSTGTEPVRPEFPVGNAYEILGVSETSSFEEIKSSFRRLAKETHPDLAPHDQNADAASSSSRFIQILAAYEILSDSVKRAHYDKYLLSRKELVQNQMHFVRGSKLYVYRSKMMSFEQMEVVEWLKWYRFAINEIVSEKKVVAGTGYFDVLESDFYAAIHMAYYGPEIESLDLLPDRFEAEERSIYETPEVLHLVSGRDLFGIVCLVSTIPELSPSCTQRLNNFTSSSLGICEANGTSSVSFSSNTLGDDIGVPNVAAGNGECQKTDAYKDLELHVSGKLVALATRIPPKRRPDGIHEEDALDQIHIFLCIDSNATRSGQGFSQGSFLGDAIRSTVPLGTIMGLGTSPEEGSCFVYDSSGTKTHVIMKHRTLLVKHMHWYRVGDKVSVCECRCSRARLPPSKFWVFEPRCGMHDIGGWYVETFGRDKKGRTVPSQRYWDGPEIREEYEKRLHPAVYLLALAYRTLDLELTKRRKRTIRDIVEGQAFKVLQWCKKLLFWLFEPRCGMHDVGGWYIETFGRDKKGRTLPSQRYWDGPERSEQYEKTLDLEVAKRWKRTIKDIVEGQVFKVLHWCKKFVWIPWVGFSLLLSFQIDLQI